jgi:hypothetical protein
MSRVRFQTIAEQVAGHLRRELLSGIWNGLMPGKHEIAAELGVNHKTVESALRLLEAEGLLVSQGPGRRRRIELPEEPGPRVLRVGILAFDTAFKSENYMVDLQHQLKEAGHRAEYLPKTLLDLGMDPSRVDHLIRRNPADAWVVCGGARPILEWFVRQELPTFALFGRRRGLPLAGAGPDKVQAMTAAVRHLIGLGHRRIVVLVREEMRTPRPSTLVQNAFLNVMESHGIPPGSYNLPAWDETPAGFRQILESLFHVTPPTALVLDESWTMLPTLQFCLSRGLDIPRDLSLICGDPDPSFDWSVPTISHIRWNPSTMVRRVVRWVDRMAEGKLDRRQTLTHATWVPGGTIGPAREA